MTEVQWLIIGTYLVVFLGGMAIGSVASAIQAVKLYKDQADRDIKELNRVMNILVSHKPKPLEEGEEWKVKCVHGNSIMTECVQCEEQNKGK